MSKQKKDLANPIPPRAAGLASQSSWITRDCKRYAGVQLIVDMWGAERIDDPTHVEHTLVEAAEAAGATLLQVHTHHFESSGGVSCVILLTNSHISVHTWPERGYAAFDMFMCGDTEPHKAIEVLTHVFVPKTVDVTELLRGGFE